MHTLMTGPLFTRKQYELLPEGFPAELIEGFLVKTPSSTNRHGRVGSRIRAALLPLVGPDRLPLTPADVAIDDHNVFQPDVIVLDRPPADEDSSYAGVPTVAIEVLSPSTRHRDRHTKAERLLEIGVAEVWLVDPIAQTIEVRTERERTYARGSAFAESGAVPGFELSPAALFAPPAEH